MTTSGYDLEPERLPVTTSDGIPLYAIRYRASTPVGTPCIILHGIASHLGWYAPLAEELARRGTTTIIFDRRGVARSGGPRGHMDRWQDVVEDILLVADAAGLTQSPFHLIGISLGGLFALATSLLHRNRVGRLVLMAPALKSRITIPLNRRLRVLQRAFTDPEHLYEIPFGPETIADRDDWRQALLADDERTRMVSARFLVQMYGMQKFVRRTLDRLRTPTLMLLGGKDRVIDNDAILTMLDGLSIPVQAEVFEQACHLMPSAIPRNEIIERVLEQFETDCAYGGPFRVDHNGAHFADELLPPPPPPFVRID